MRDILTFLMQRRDDTDASDDKDVKLNRRKSPGTRIILSAIMLMMTVHAVTILAMISQQAGWIEIDVVQEAMVKSDR